MTSGSSDVRAARFALAKALGPDPAGREEAEDQLRKALDEPGDDPSAWVIHLELARAFLAREQGQSEGIAHVLEAMQAAGPDSLSDAARRAVELLDAHEAAELAPWVTADHLQRVRAIVGPSRDRSLRLLGARFGYLRGDSELAGAMLEGQTLPADSPAWLQAARLVGDAHAALGRRDPEGALEAIGERPDLGDEPTVVGARALALYARGDTEGALGLTEGAPASYDVAVARTLARLLEASRAGYGGRAEPVDAAADAAAEAARLDPTQSDSLLLLAEVKLEGCLGLDEGRQLLRSAIAPMDDDRSPIWWRVQCWVRDDDEVFRYFLLEVDSARGMYDEVARQAAEMTLGTTEYMHDGAVHELHAEALRQRGAPGEEVGEAYRRASAAFDQANAVALALRSLRALGELGLPAQPGVSLDMADLLWRLTFTEGDDAAGALRDGLAELDALPAPLSSDEADRGGYLRGLYLVRRIELESLSGQQARFDPLPWLLVAAESAPESSYRAGHLAWALSDANQHRAAHVYAERALDIDEEEGWLVEAFIVTSFNWRGELEDRARELLPTASAQDETWGRTLLAFDRLLAGDARSATSLLADGTFPVPWGRYVEAMAKTRAEGATVGAPLLQGFIDGSTDLAGDASAAIDCALCLGDVEQARRVLAIAREAGSFSERGLQLNGGLIDVAAGEDPTAAERVREAIAGIVRPLHARELARVSAPCLAEVAERPEIAQAFGEIGAAAEARLAELTNDAPMTADLDAGVSLDVSSATSSAVRDLLDAADLRRAGDLAAAQARVASLGDRTDDPRLREVLGVLESRLAEPALEP